MSLKLNSITTAEQLVTPSMGKRDMMVNGVSDAELRHLTFENFDRKRNAVLLLELLRDFPRVSLVVLAGVADGVHLHVLDCGGGVFEFRTVNNSAGVEGGMRRLVDMEAIFSGGVGGAAAFRSLLGVSGDVRKAIAG